MSRVNIILNMISLQKKLFVRAAQIGVRNISISHALRKSHYDTLGVSKDATQAEIKNAYFELSKLYHPDRIAATDENLAKFREVSAAYEILGNEHSRRLYDKGMLGELTKLAEEEITDPVVKFYKKRQEVTKSQMKSEEDMEAWTQTYFKEAKSRETLKHHLYARSKRVEEELHPGHHPFPLYAAAVVAILFVGHFEGSKVDQVRRKILSFF